MRLSVVFMGTPDFAVPALQAVADAHDVVCVYTQPPRPAGRGKKPRPSPVHQAAEARGLCVRHPATLKDPADRQAFADLGADVAVVAAYGLILPRAVLDAPRLGCINIHASLLPRWRGAAPIHRAIMAGDAESGVTIMRMDAGLDTGPMLLKGTVPIGPTTTTADLHDALAAMGGPLVLEVLDHMAAGVLSETPQPDAGVTYAAKIDKAEARIDWSRPAGDLDRLVRGLNPFPGAFFTLHGERIKVLLATPLEDPRAEDAPAEDLIKGWSDAAPGTVLDDRLTVACGAGTALRLDRLQRAGKAPVAADAFLRGCPVAAGTLLSGG